MITVRKIKVYCDDSTFYSFLRNEQMEQNKALNMAITLLHSANTIKSIDSGAEIRILKAIEKNKQAVEKLKQDLETKKTESAKEKIIEKIKLREDLIEQDEKILEEGKVFRKGLDKEFSKIYIDTNNLYQVLSSNTKISYMKTLDLAVQKAKADYSNNFVNIVTGQQSLQNYKSDIPLMIDKKNINLFKEDNNYKIRIMLGYELNVVTGNKQNDELITTLDRIINGEYSICQSSLMFDKANRVIFNLCLDIPDKKGYEPVKDRVLGVDLGIKYPVYMSIPNTYYKKSLGRINDFLRVRQQMQDRRKKLQSELQLTKGGKGRNRKLQALDRLKEKERNFVKTYNHTLSSRIVEYAKKNKCEYINIENLTKDGFPNSILRNWSYYELQTMVTYKAKREGIIVRKVNPAYTSQKCSSCGHIDSDNRQTQEDFRCVKCGFEANADYNASINIANSTEFVR